MSEANPTSQSEPIKHRTKSFGCNTDLDRKRKTDVIDPRRTDTPDLYLGKGKGHEFLIVQRARSFQHDNHNMDDSPESQKKTGSAQRSYSDLTSSSSYPLKYTPPPRLKLDVSFASTASSLDDKVSISLSRKDYPYNIINAHSTSEIFSDLSGIEDDEGDVETSVGTYGLNNKENSSDPVVDEVLVLDEQTERQLKLISVGGFSKIYEYKRNGTKVALKVSIGYESTNVSIDWDLVGAPWDSPTNRLDREVEILKGLRHPNIIRLIAAGYSSDRRCKRRYMILELLPKEGMLSLKPTLRTIPIWRRLLARKQSRRGDAIKRELAGMDAKDAAAKGVQLARALGYLHKALDGKIIVHGNICPDNIGIADDGQLKIMGFSSCCVRYISEEEATLDRVWDYTVRYDEYKGILPFSCGALRYMAPEVASKEASVSPASDVYSLGLLLWSLVSGVDPYEDITRSSFYSRVVHYEERPDCNISWPEPLRNIVHLCWSANPESRPSVATVEMALCKIVLKRNIANRTNL